MTDPTMHIGPVLKRIRAEKGLTLEDTSELTGVSKAMLGQIERGESIPTISTLWKISSGLRLSFSELLRRGTDPNQAIDIHQLEPVQEADGAMLLYDVFPFNPLSGFEYFYIRLMPGGVHPSAPHRNSAEEYVVVTAGVLEVLVGEKVYRLEAPAALHFKANQPHTYRNPGKTETIFQNIVKYGV